MTMPKAALDPGKQYWIHFVDEFAGPADAPKSGLNVILGETAAGIWCSPPELKKSCYFVPWRWVHSIKASVAFNRPPAS